MVPLQTPHVHTESLDLLQDDAHTGICLEQKNFILFTICLQYIKRGKLTKYLRFLFEREGITCKTNNVT